MFNPLRRRCATCNLPALLLDASLRLAILATLPLVAAGLWLGNHAHFGIIALAMQRLIGAILVVAGMSLLWHAWV